MKIVIQNGCEHALNRKEIESTVKLFPESWSRNVKTIALYQGKEPEVTTDYYKKEQILGLFSPKECRSKEAKAQAVAEMLIGLECIAENSDLLKSIGKSVRTRLLERTSALRDRCLLLVNNNAK